MPGADFPAWTMLSFPALVLALALLPTLAPRYWHHRWFQLVIVACCTLPVVICELSLGRAEYALQGARSYVTFVVTLGALFTASGGVALKGDLAGTPRNNVRLLLAGAMLASIIGTTGASMLLVRPLLKANRERQFRGHLVPFFIVLVANVGGLLTPLGDPPLLVGYIEGVPFFWTLRLLPIWLLYVAWVTFAFYLVDRRAYRREAASARTEAQAKRAPLALLGRRNLIFLCAIVPAALLPAGFREAALAALGLGSYFATPRAVHEANGFDFAPMLEVALVFVGLFLCLGPVEAALAEAAPHLPLRAAWQLFWGSGVLSSVLDNAPTYSAFAALARGLPSAHAVLVAGIDPTNLAAISAGSVVMGATTYLGNGPNLMVKAVAERERYVLPSFLRYCGFALLVLMPAHLAVTAALVWLPR